MRILLVHDSAPSAEPLRRVLLDERFLVESVEASGALGKMGEGFRLIVLNCEQMNDATTGFLDGLRTLESRPPLLTISETSWNGCARAAGSLGRVLVRPFSRQSLLDAVRELTADDGDAAQNHTLRYRDVALDVKGRRAERNGVEIKLTPRESALLEYFLRNPERVLTRTDIGENVWDVNFEAGSNVIDVYVSMLRRKIDRSFDAPLIHTVVGSGYVLSAHKSAPRPLMTQTIAATPAVAVAGAHNGSA